MDGRVKAAAAALVSSGLVVLACAGPGPSPDPDPQPHGSPACVRMDKDHNVQDARCDDGQ